MSEKINIGVVGLRFGKGMSKHFIVLGKGGKYLNITAVCDFNREITDEYAAEIGAKAYYDLDDLLRDPDIEAVALFTPPGGRAKLIRKCIAAGKHVLTTKPFELDPQEAYSVLKEAREKNIVVHLNSPNPVPTEEMVQVEKWKRDYNLGRVVAGNFEVMMDKNEVPDGSWYDDPELCPAAPLYRIGIYALNDMIAIFDDAPVAAFCVDTRIRTGRPTADNAILTVQFAGGALGTIQSSFCVGNGDEFIGSYTIHFERGSISRGPYVVREDGAIGKYDFTIRWRTEAGEPHSECFRLTPGADRSGDYEWEFFAEAVRKGGIVLPGQIPIENIVNGVSVIDAMKRSLKSHALETVESY
ncbi:MAG: Gfo/Idh/MocA family oxidoreductase [Lentisphaerae bacterium]|nr:Gfo/Idh/MocA family oxidoreductase [Lentisphaerota bacterium]